VSQKQRRLQESEVGGQSWDGLEAQLMGPGTEPPKPKNTRHKLCAWITRSWMHNGPFYSSYISWKFNYKRDDVGLFLIYHHFIIGFSRSRHIRDSVFTVLVSAHYVFTTSHFSSDLRESWDRVLQGRGDANARKKMSTNFANSWQKHACGEFETHLYMHSPPHLV